MKARGEYYRVLVELLALPGVATWGRLVARLCVWVSGPSSSGSQHGRYAPVVAGTGLCC